MARRTKEAEVCLKIRVAGCPFDRGDSLHSPAPGNLKPLAMMVVMVMMMVVVAFEGLCRRSERHG